MVLINDVSPSRKRPIYRRETREIAPCRKVSYFCIWHAGGSHVSFQWCINLLIYGGLVGLRIGSVRLPLAF